MTICVRLLVERERWFPRLTLSREKERLLCGRKTAKFSARSGITPPAIFLTNHRACAPSSNNFSSGSLHWAAQKFSFLATHFCKKYNGEALNLLRVRYIARHDAVLSRPITLTLNSGTEIQNTTVIVRAKTAIANYIASFPFTSSISRVQDPSTFKTK